MSMRYLIPALFPLLVWSCSSGEESSSATAPADTPKASQAEQIDAGADEDMPPLPPFLEDLGLKMTQIASAKTMETQWLHQAVNAARGGDYKALQEHVHANKGMFFIDRPGIAQDIHMLQDANALKKTSWDAFRMGNAKAINERAMFSVSPFKVSPDWMEKQIKDFPGLKCQVEGEFSYLPDLISSLEEYGFLSLDEAGAAQARELAGMVEHEVLIDWVYYYFGRVNGKWKLIGMDIARCDFSA